MASARVLVVHPPVSIARDFIDYPYFTDLGAVQLAAVLRARGNTVSLVDAYALPDAGLTWRTDGRAHLGASVKAVLDAARAAGTVDCVVVTLTPFHRPPGRCDVLGAVLAGLGGIVGDAPLWLADGYQSGQHYIETDGRAVLGAYPEAAVWVPYEAEVTVPALVEALARGEPPTGVHRGVEIPVLDDLPPPAWDLVDLTAHDGFCARVVAGLGRGAWAFPIGGRTLPVITSRGCPFTCAHCSSNPGRAVGAPKTQRRYSAGRIRADLETLVRTHGATRLAVLDELANVNERHWDTVLDTMATLDVRFDVPNGLRADYLTRDHLTRMRGRAATVSVSAESGSQRVVTEVVGKRLDLTAIVRAAADAHAVGVPLMVHYIIGMPGETAEEVNTTLAFAMDLHTRYGAWPAVQFATPLPGTALARGRALPVVDDWGPRFQTVPSQPGAGVTPTELMAFRAALDGRLRGSEEARTVVLALTGACNNRCPFCAVATEDLPAGTRELSDAHGVLVRHRAAGAGAVVFDGGEPTMHPGLIPMVKTARALGYDRVTVITNGRRCAYEGYARALVTAGLTDLWFSLHGADAEAHGRQVGSPEASGQTVAGIENTLRHVPTGVTVGVRTALAEENLEAVVARVWALGIRRMVLHTRTTETRTVETVAETAVRVLARWRDRMTLQVSGLPRCVLGAYADHAMADPGHAREVRITPPGAEGLLAYRAPSRVRRAVCGPCTQAVACGGFYGVTDTVRDGVDVTGIVRRKPTERPSVDAGT